MHTSSHRYLLTLIFLRRPVQFDSLGEVVQRYEAHLLIPTKSYPLINWRTALLGTGEGLQPLTWIERETGAAILIRTLRRSIIRKPAPFGLAALSGAMSDSSPELKRLEDALFAVQSKVEMGAGGVAKAGGLNTNAPPSVDASNMALPPTPKPDENPSGRLLPNAPDVRLKVATTGNSGPNTPPARSPTAGKGESSTHQLPLGQGKLTDEKPVATAAETDVEASVPMPGRKLDIHPKLTGAVGEEIGLHCWIIATLQEEVDQAAVMLQTLFEEKIKMFEDWAEENEFDPAWFDEEEDSEDDESDDEDEEKDDEKPKPDLDVEMNLALTPAPV